MTVRGEVNDSITAVRGRGAPSLYFDELCIKWIAFLSDTYVRGPFVTAYSPKMNFSKYGRVWCASVSYPHDTMIPLWGSGGHSHKRGLGVRPHHLVTRNPTENQQSTVYLI